MSRQQSLGFLLLTALVLENTQCKYSVCLDQPTKPECQPQLVIQKPTNLSLNMSDPICVYAHLWNLSGISPLKLQLAQKDHPSKDIDSFSLWSPAHSPISNDAKSLQDYFRCDENGYDPHTGACVRPDSTKTADVCKGLAGPAATEQAQYSCLLAAVKLSPAQLAEFTQDKGGPLNLQAVDVISDSNIQTVSSMTDKSAFSFKFSSSLFPTAQMVLRGPLPAGLNPNIEQIGFTANGLSTLQRGITGTAVSKSFFTYNINNGTIQNVSPSAFLPTFPIIWANQTASFTAQAVAVLSTTLDSMNNAVLGLPIYDCPVAAQTLSDCRLLQSPKYPNGLPPKTQGMTLSPSGTWLAFLDDQGQLYASPVPAPGSDLNWTAVGSPPASGATALIAMADLDGDQAEDLAWVHSTTGQVAVFKGSSSGFTLHGPLSKSLQLAVDGLSVSSSKPVTALALGDVDGDAKAEVVVVQSGQVVVLLGPDGCQRTDYQVGWKATLTTPAGQKEEQTAVALRGSGVPGGADLLVAVTTSTSAMPPQYNQSWFLFSK